MVINLISGPRNLSTALMYAFAQRYDTAVFDEPFYGFYLEKGKPLISHPSHQEIIEEMETEKAKIIAKINEVAKTSHVFVKGMAHHYLSFESQYILNWKNIILIRHPKKLIASFSKVIENPTIDDIGIKKASELFLFLKKNNKTPLVIDSDELLLNPKKYLVKISKALQIPFQEEMLSWKKGGIPEDGIWAKHWYKNVHNSNGFSVQKASLETTFSKKLQPILNQAMTYYNILKSEVLKND